MVLPINSQQDLGTDQKKLPVCPKCKDELDNRVPRGFFVKHFLFFLPLKRYVCYRCQRKRYIIG
jgi:ribosomal protein L37AE/L43A